MGGVLPAEYARAAQHDQKEASLKEFDFERAWNELIVPEYKALPQNVIELVKRTNVESAELTQQVNLDMPWPETGLKKSFEEIPAEILAPAARVIYSYGHWAPFRSQCEGLQDTGGYWKFSNYADQVLTTEVGLQRDRTARKQPVLSFAVHEGVLRIQYSTSDEWSWTEFGWATNATWMRQYQIEGLVTLEREIEDKYTPGGYAGPFRGEWITKRRKLFETYAAKLIEACADERFHRLTNIEPYMVERKRDG